MFRASFPRRCVVVTFPSFPPRIPPLGLARTLRHRLAIWLLVGSLTSLQGIAEATPPAPTAFAPNNTVELPLRQLTGGPLVLRGTHHEHRIHLGVRLDEMVVRGRLRLALTPSPALLPTLSHLQVHLNDKLMAVIPLRTDKAGERIVRDIDLDPRLFLDDNWLSLRMVGHYTLECEDELHSSLWTEVDVEASGFELGLRPLTLEDELALFPTPWFDRRGRGRIEVPFVLGPEPGRDRLIAASIMASWLGSLAAERGATFPVGRDRLPDRHAIVLATPEQPAPKELALPIAQGPTVRLMRHPALPHVKLLVLQGRNDAELRTAALGLVLGRQAMSGGSALVQAMAPIPVRPPYDAPNWVATDRPVRLGELVSGRAALQLNGTRPDDIRVRWRTPPDLWQGPGRAAQLDLRYRASMASLTESSLMSLALNDSFVRAWRLSPALSGESMLGLGQWLGSVDDASGQVRLALPAFQPLQTNTLDVRMPLGMKPQTGNCAGNADTTRASVDADSTLDFSALPHFLEMPDLAAFAAAGFPFTRYADLSQTSIVLPPRPDDKELETLFALMGSFGRWTGTAAWHFDLTSPEQLENGLDRDLLLIGGPRLNGLLARWQKNALLVMDEKRRETQGLLSPVAEWRSWLQRRERDDAPAVQAPLRLEAEGALAVIMGFESPLRAGRSVVALNSNQTQSLHGLSASLLDPVKATRIRGAISVVRDQDVQSFDGAPSYHTGHLPVTARMHLLLSKHPWMVAVALALSMGFLVWIVRLRLRQRAAQRLKVSRPKPSA